MAEAAKKRSEESKPPPCHRREGERNVTQSLAAVFVPLPKSEQVWDGAAELWVCTARQYQDPGLTANHAKSAS